MDSIGGSALCLMVACVSPAASYCEETLNTLMYATRAKRITNKPRMQTDPHTAMLTSMRQEIELLRNENEYLRSIVVRSCRQLLEPSLPPCKAHIPPYYAHIVYCMWHSYLSALLVDDARTCLGSVHVCKDSALVCDLQTLRIIHLSLHACVHICSTPSIKSCKWRARHHTAKGRARRDSPACLLPPMCHQALHQPQ